MKTWHTKSGYTIYCILAGRSNVFLLSGNGINILVDTSPGHKWNKLKRRIKELNISNIDLLILTHTHFDHAANAKKIRDEYGAKVIVNKLESDFLLKGENPMIHGTVMMLRSVVKILAPIILKKQNYEGCPSDILVDQQLDLKESGFNAYILHTPGHSPGSQSVIVDNEIALTGDALFGVFPGSVFPPFAADENELLKSWGKLLDTGCSIFLPSHGTADSKQLLIKDYNKRRMKIS
jgi:glyoxylase-like metal-dependent hydrolase (beta-lactamase superfamily II)